MSDDHPLGASDEEMAAIRRLFAPDWRRRCDNCGATPVVPVSHLCGPCHFGQAAAVDGGWWDHKRQTIRDDISL